MKGNIIMHHENLAIARKTRPMYLFLIQKAGFIETDYIERDVLRC